MDNTQERQQRYRKKMYKAGFKQIIIWVLKKETKYKEINMKEFVKKLKIIIAEWDNEKTSELLQLLLKITKSKKEEEKLRKKV